MRPFAVVRTSKSSARVASRLPFEADRPLEGGLSLALAWRETLVLLPLWINKCADHDDDRNHQACWLAGWKTMPTVGTKPGIEFVPIYGRSASSAPIQRTYELIIIIILVTN